MVSIDLVVFECDEAESSLVIDDRSVHASEKNYIKEICILPRPPCRSRERPGRNPRSPPLLPSFAFLLPRRRQGTPSGKARACVGGGGAPSLLARLPGGAGRPALAAALGSAAGRVAGGSAGLPFGGAVVMAAAWSAWGGEARAPPPPDLMAPRWRRRSGMRRGPRGWSTRDVSLPDLMAPRWRQCLGGGWRRQAVAGAEISAALRRVQAAAVPLRGRQLRL
ncbi:uncharacterized protein LOC125548366 [Triticum urartu]|uniref:uncharacterized protein LOC125548366 n=1 Tax=Triticum urartu TaxID=4572 RepID=UPI002044B100|nr:uncharacterized protein LOC125548366 [Triticum urartu]XP_048567945.1 uncharacterized protein LOC125548366 [Triticum urartu]